MLKSVKTWALVAAAMGGTFFLGGCFGGNWALWTAILNEDIFG